ncbi:Response regulator [Rubrivivax sp. A210]|uniref:response regulator transcription factor n=1 Tax=Rubrivivax sp. A210 TaxID=2772301 RepID=UPI00191B1C53|nr:response regulator [Rubrivivax sp. A210]CAD5373358.1 Response regulator [Rubrivivax sp. A210]
MKSILIVDDVAEIRRLVRICTLHRYEVSEAATAEEGLFVLAKKRPDLVILDIALPGAMDGLDFLARLRSNPDFGATRVLMLSGRGVQGETLGLPVDAYFTKPFSPLELIDCIDGLLQDSFPTTLQKSLP